MESTHREEESVSKSMPCRRRSIRHRRNSNKSVEGKRTETTTPTDGGVDFRAKFVSTVSSSSSANDGIAIAVGAVAPGVVAGGDTDADADAAGDRVPGTALPDASPRTGRRRSRGAKAVRAASER